MTPEQFKEARRSLAYSQQALADLKKKGFVETVADEDGYLSLIHI